MRLSDPNTVDFLCITKTGAVSVVLLDDYDASDEHERLQLLQAKLHRYFDFIESGEVYGEATKVAKRDVPPTTPVAIEIIAKTEFGELGQRFLGHVREDAAAAGVGFSWRVKPE